MDLNSDGFTDILSGSYSRMKPLVKKFFALCSKYQVTYVKEGESVEMAKQQNTFSFGSASFCPKVAATLHFGWHV